MANRDNARQAFEAAAEFNSCGPRDVTRSMMREFLSQCLDPPCTANELEHLGGFGHIRNSLFPAEHDLTQRYASAEINKHKRRVETEYGRATFMGDDFLKTFESLIERSNLRLYKPRVARPVARQSERDLCVLLTDWHMGLMLDGKSINNLNKYDWTIAARRMGRLTDQVISYKEFVPRYHETTTLRIMIGGDMTAGIIHDQEWGVDLMTHQVIGAANTLGQSISLMAATFDRVIVHCQVGNHGRYMHKGNKGRQSSQKWDSFDTLMHVMVKKHLKHHDNVEFDIPKEPLSLLDVRGHLFSLTHYDTVINVGNVGASLNMKSIDNQINKINATLDGNRRIAVSLGGHGHIPDITKLENGCIFVMGGTASGLDEFAFSIGVRSNHPTQFMFECTEKYPIGDMRFIDLKEADEDESLEIIIKPYEGELG